MSQSKDKISRSALKALASMRPTDPAEPAAPAPSGRKYHFATFRFQADDRPYLDGAKDHLSRKEEFARDNKYFADTVILRAALSLLSLDKRFLETVDELDRRDKRRT